MPHTQITRVAFASICIFLFHSVCRAGVTLSAESQITAAGVWKPGLPGLPPGCDPADFFGWSTCRHQRGPLDAAIGSFGGTAYSGVNAFNARADAVAVAEYSFDGESGMADFEFLSSATSTSKLYDRGDGVNYWYSGYAQASSQSWATIEVPFNITVPTNFKWKASQGAILTGDWRLVQDFSGFLFYMNEHGGSDFPPSESTLAPGNYTLSIARRGNYATTEGDTEHNDAYSWATVSWTLDDVFMGEEPTKPIPPRRDELPPPLLPNAGIAEADLRYGLLVSGQLGRTYSLYVGVPTEIAEGPNAGANILGYCFQSRHSAVSSVVVPELPAGTTELTVRYDGGSQVVVPGETIELGPTGTKWFALSGFNPAFASDASDALVLGMTFAADGAAQLSAFGQGIAGDIDLDGDVDGADAAKLGSSFGHASDAECSRRDVDFDGAISLADLALLQTRLGQTSPALQAASPVPEPESLVTVVIAVSILGFQGPRRRKGIGRGQFRQQ
jgi:hypothetical protein